MLQRVAVISLSRICTIMFKVTPSVCYYCAKFEFPIINSVICKLLTDMIEIFQIDYLEILIHF